MKPLIFTAKLWKWQGKAAWYFITLPLAPSRDIKFAQGPRRGFGAVRVDVSIGSTAWQTSIFPESKSGCYILPVKAAVRKKEKLATGKPVKVRLTTDQRGRSKLKITNK